jgi:hypothetical protein
LPRLTPEEDGLVAPPPLPRLTMPDTAQDVGLKKAASSFLRSLGDVGRYFPKMLSALFLSRKDGRLLLIRDTSANNIRWQVCLQLALPSAVAWRLTWSSYQDDPRNAGQISATCGETSYRIDRNAQDYQYYLFDFTADQFSAVPEDNESYALQISNWLLNAPDTLMDFHRFSGWFTTEMILDRLPDLLMLFSMACGEEGWSAEDWNKAADLVRIGLDSPTQERLLELFQSQCEKISDDSLAPWFSFYVELATNSDSPLAVLSPNFLKRLFHLVDPIRLGQQLAMLAKKEKRFLEIANRVRQAFSAVNLRKLGDGFLKQMPLPPEGLDLRKKLVSIGCEDLLLGEWDRYLLTGNHPLNTWKMYRKHVLDQLPELSLKYGSTMAESAWAATSAGNTEKKALEWCEQDDLSFLSSATKEEIIVKAFQNLPFNFAEAPNHQERHLLALAGHWKITLSGNRSRLRILQQLPRSSNINVTQVTDDYSQALHNVFRDSSEYSAFLTSYFHDLFLFFLLHSPQELLVLFAAPLDMQREMKWCDALLKALACLPKSQRQEDDFRCLFLECWVMNDWNKFLSLQSYRRLLPKVAGIYLDEAGLQLLEEWKPSVRRDELLKECQRKYALSVGTLLRKSWSAGKRIFGRLRHAPETPETHSQLGQSPNQLPNRSLNQLPQQPLTQSQNQLPNRSLNQLPQQPLNQSPNRSLNQLPQQPLNQSPNKSKDTHDRPDGRGKDVKS